MLFGTYASISSCYYTIRNLHLTAEVQSPAPDQLSQLMRQTNNSYEYNSISGFYATIQNSYATINFHGPQHKDPVWAAPTAVAPLPSPHSHMRVASATTDHAREAASARRKGACARAPCISLQPTLTVTDQTEHNLGTALDHQHITIAN